jgi:3-hydroxyisobutyrate dehydrogenase
MQIAIIGLGEVGQCYARLLHAAGHSLHVCAPRPNAAAIQMAAEFGLLVPADIAACVPDADWVFSCVTGASALQVVREIARYARAGATLCDFTTAGVALKKEAASLVAAAGLRYVDVAIMGAIALGREKTPLLASGAGAQAFADMLNAAGARVRVTAGVAGDAMALKLLRSQFTKGLEALGVEVSMAAEQQGLREQLFEQLQDMDDTPLRSFMDMLVRTHVVHARRRAQEVRDVMQGLDAAGLPSTVLPGVAQRFDATADALLAHPLQVSAPDAEEALQWLLQHARR